MRRLATAAALLVLGACGGGVDCTSDGILTCDGHRINRCSDANRTGTLAWSEATDCSKLFYFDENHALIEDPGTCFECRSGSIGRYVTCAPVSDTSPCNVP